MKLYGHILIAVWSALSVSWAEAPSQSPAVLLQEALYQEETAGDLDKAIDLYGQVLEQAAEVERLAARATYQLGLCYLKKGDASAAADYFRKAVSHYPKQSSIVKKALAQLDKLAPPEPEAILFEELPKDVLIAIGNLYGKTCSKAGLQNLYTNSHIYYVNTDFVLFSGGYGYYTNPLNISLTQKVRLSTTSNPGLIHYDIAGRRMNTEIVPDEEQPGFYTIYWTPSEPLGPGQFYMYGWCGQTGKKLTVVPEAANEPDHPKYALTMQNHFGEHAFEVFYLVLPAGLQISDMAEPCTDKQAVDDFIIYAWEKEVPAGDDHVVTLYLSKGNPAGGQTVLEDSFESGDQTPDGWEKGASVPGVSYIWDRNTGKDGTASLCLKKDVEKYFPIAQWTRNVAYTGDAKELTVSAQVRARKAYKAVIDALFLDDQGQWIKHEWVSYIGAKEAGDPPANHNWKDYTGTVEIPDKTNTIVIGLQMYGPGTVWFDDLKAGYTNGMESDKQAATANETEPLKAEDLIAEGWQLWQQRKLAEAEAKFKEAARSDPDNDGAWQGLGWAQFNQGKKQNAEAAFKKCVKLNPQNAAALNGLGWIEHGNGDIDAAIKWWEKAVKVSQGAATASLNGLTQVYMERQDYAKAAQYYQLWLKSEPNNQDAMAGLEKAKRMTAH